MKTINTMADLFAFWRDNPDAVVASSRGEELVLDKGFGRWLSPSDRWPSQDLGHDDFPMTYSPPRDVFTDPKPGDVIETGPAHDIASCSVLFVMEDYVFYECVSGKRPSPGARSRADWAAMKSDGWRVKP